MISKLCLNKVNSFKNIATLQTDKKINLIYGLNGTGKSTLSDFLYNLSNEDFSNCSLERLNSEEILVYNQSFVRDYFYQPDSLKGIFTLSKENKEAEEKIKKANEELIKYEDYKFKRTVDISSLKAEIAQKKQITENKIWEIKTNYTGGDRVLEFCLEGLKGQKEKLLNFISEIKKPKQKPEITIDELKKETESIKGENAQKYDTVKVVDFSAQRVESNVLLQKEIIGNENCTVAELIKKLNNSDWVKTGLNYLPDETEIDENGKPCPFCQQNTITKTVIYNIIEYFDESYEKDIKELKKLLATYQSAISSISPKENYNIHPVIVENKTDINNEYNKVISILNDNLRKIESKLLTPSKKTSLQDSTEAITSFNNLIKNMNLRIVEHNERIDNIDVSMKQVKNTFWSIMRWDYDQTIEAFLRETEKINKRISSIEDEIFEIEKCISLQRKVIIEEQKNTVNIEEAITNINNGLIDLGIDCFKIVKYSDSFYKIVRNENTDHTFQTLSEGEKMIISFLYFRELCNGKKSSSETSNKKIIVIDDPISSLSHIYVFNIGQFIKKDFFNSPNYEQVFVLTHSLYFYYELTDTNHERRKNNQKLFRMIKNCDGSQIIEMKYEEIQNDYQSYWHIIKDVNQAPALIANCMRNIIEYFFNFIEKTDLNNVFQKPELQAIKYQAFCRYINRESHSLGQNIFDLKEFNYDEFKEAFSLVFIINGYKAHFDKMMK